MIIIIVDAQNKIHIVAAIAKIKTRETLKGGGKCSKKQ